jgi:hypothetical protein
MPATVRITNYCLQKWRGLARERGERGGLGAGGKSVCQTRPLTQNAIASSGRHEHLPLLPRVYSAERQQGENFKTSPA